jgi:hypothetical protein
METTKNEKWITCRTAFLSLRNEHKIFFLVILAHEITICVREVSVGTLGKDTIIERVIMFNELQHVITSQLRHMLAHENKRYSDESFIDILFKKAQKKGCENLLVQAVEFSLRYSTK